ncbi:hypothetical protein V6N11_081542 [Hibiscus sabdariffa]|uniref:Uncharacterized protein n=2 Tax=Hibiscus sabdariffa TaxID=183260 RepID=A0ABR2ABB4_9ROSI
MSNGRGGSKGINEPRRDGMGLAAQVFGENGLQLSVVSILTVEAYFPELNVLVVAINVACDFRFYTGKSSGVWQGGTA